ncbi:MAG: hypothetical protein KKF41_00060 [Actinobacteria bacterium]|nr:hypothetical protein [Actinomycetota bacterium]MBU1943237.1 hypothetical protein [Actinomycetota bacterium]MBU2685960.1 hypothetical protein [Actinomycetota bacterium]
MKKSLVLALSISLSACAVFAAAGCGENTGTARTYMEQADATFEEASEAADDLQKAQEGAIGALVGQDPAAFVATGALLPDIKKGIDDYEKKLQAAATAYRKIDTLEGVAPYKTYAKKMLEVIDVYLESVVVGRAIVAEVEKVIAQIQSGQPVDMAAATKPMFDQIKRALDLRNEALALEKEAGEYRNAQKLLVD